MTTNLSQQKISTWRELDHAGDLSKTYVRYDFLDRIIERISTKPEISVGGPALRQTTGYINSIAGDVMAEKYEIVNWIQAYEDAVNGWQIDGTFI